MNEQKNGIWKIAGFKTYNDNQGDQKVRICCVRLPDDPTFVGIETKSFSVDPVMIISLNGAKLVTEAECKPYFKENGYCIRLDVYPVEDQ